MDDPAMENLKCQVNICNDGDADGYPFVPNKIGVNVNAKNVQLPVTVTLRIVPKNS